MWLWRTEVDLAVRRPPRADITVYGVVSAWTAWEAELTACLMAIGFHPHTVMPVASRSEEIREGL